MPTHPLAILQSLVLIGAANSAPVFLRRLFGECLAQPIDGGLVLRDGHPLLGHSKTWRGLAAAILLATFAAVLIGLPWQAGALVGASAMAGDCLSSFTKRRLGLESSRMALGLDQVPESLLPALSCSAYAPLGPLDFVVIVSVFFVGELALSRLFFALGLRDRPY
jgi:CDP-diglyceride synthetase